LSRARRAADPRYAGVFPELLGRKQRDDGASGGEHRRLRASANRHNIPVYYTAQPKEQSDEDRALLNDMWGPGLTRSPEQQRVAALAPDEADTVLVKWRYSAFHRSPLEQMLKETGRNQLISPAFTPISAA
jgi:isochorismate hydrolase